MHQDAVPGPLHEAKKPLSMESLFQVLDEMDDFIIATALRLHRWLSWKPRERRKVPRTPDGYSQSNINSWPKADFAMEKQLTLIRPPT
jgi:hypothetical protein